MVAAWVHATDPEKLVTASVTGAARDYLAGRDPLPAEEAVGRLMGIGLLSLHYHAWRANLTGADRATQGPEGVPAALERYQHLGKPLLLSDAGSWERGPDGEMIRADPDLVATWAEAALAQAAGFEHLTYGYSDWPEHARRLGEVARARGVRLLTEYGQQA